MARTIPIVLVGLGNVGRRVMQLLLETVRVQEVPAASAPAAPEANPS